MASFLEKLGYLTNWIDFQLFHCPFFPLYQVFSFGSVIIDLAPLSLPHFYYYLFIYEIIFLVIMLLQVEQKGRAM